MKASRIFSSTICATALLCGALFQNAKASTAAFGGEVIEVTPPTDNDKKHGTLLSFTVRIDYYDYCSWGKFGKDSVVGDPITRKVKQVS